MFRTAVCTFRTVECIFRSAERTFPTAEYRLRQYRYIIILALVI